MPIVAPHPRTVANLGLIEGERTRYSFTGIPGLQLDCIPSDTPLGSRFWRVRYYIGTARHTDTLGSFNANAQDFIPLAKATELAAERRRTARVEKVDPRTVGLSFDDLFMRWIDGHAMAHRKSWREDEKLYRRHIKARLGKHVVEDLERLDLMGIRDKIKKAATPHQADKCISLVSASLGWGNNAGLVRKTNVAHRLPKAAAQVSRDRVLTDDEVRRFWHALDNTPKADVLRLLLLTGQRLSDVTGMDGDELLADGWEIPAKRHKSKRPHFVPLTGLAASILTSRAQSRKRKGPMFPGIKRGKETGQPMSRHTPDHYMADVARMLGIEDAAVHDLRRTLATNLGAMGVPDNVIERTEGRDKRKGVAGVYNR